MLKTVLQWEVEKLVCIKQIIAFRKNGRFYLPDETSNFPTQEILPFLDQWANLFFFLHYKNFSQFLAVLKFYGIWHLANGLGYYPAAEKMGDVEAA